MIIRVSEYCIYYDYFYQVCFDGRIQPTIVGYNNLISYLKQIVNNLNAAYVLTTASCIRPAQQLLLQISHDIVK